MIYQEIQQTKKKKLLPAQFLSVQTPKKNVKKNIAIKNHTSNIYSLRCRTIISFRKLKQKPNFDSKNLVFLLTKTTKKGVKYELGKKNLLGWIAIPPGAMGLRIKVEEKRIETRLRRKIAEFRPFIIYLDGWWSANWKERDGLWVAFIDFWGMGRTSSSHNPISLGDANRDL